MPTDEKMQEYIALSAKIEDARARFNEARDDFTSLASELNYMLLEEYDYAGYILRREPPPEWLRQIPTKTWIFKQKEKQKYKPRKRTKRSSKKVVDRETQDLYSKMLGGFK
jgi:hypothetical protein